MRSSPYTVRTGNALKVRFWATVGEEPEVEVALDLPLRTRALPVELHATDVVGSPSPPRNASRNAWEMINPVE